MKRPAVAKHWADVYVEELRSQAEKARAFGDDRGAKMFEETARQVEQRRAAYEDEELTAVQGAIESGYSEQQLRNLRRGKGGNWSGRRRDLPRRPGVMATAPQLLAGDRAKESAGQLVSIAARVGRSSDAATHSRSAVR